MRLRLLLIVVSVFAGCATGQFGTEIGPRMVLGKGGISGCKMVVGRLARFPWKHLIWRDGRDLDPFLCGILNPQQLQAVKADKDAAAAREAELNKKVSELQKKVSELTPPVPAPEKIELPK